MTIVTASRSLLPPRETLGSVADTGQHMIHVAYPSATHTLCCLPTAGGEIDGPTPTCPVCRDVAARWRQIEREGW